MDIDLQELREAREPAPPRFSEQDDALAARVCRYLRDIQPRAASLEALGRRFHLSPFHLQRMFKRATGSSPHQYARSLRLEAFKAKLRAGESITDAIMGAGYGSSSRLYADCDENLGMTPTAYKKRGAGMAILYSVVPCSLGLMLVAVTERGLCKISLGDSADPLINDFAAEFAKAERQRDDETLGYWVNEILAYLDGWQPQLNLPLDLRATAFQLKVWRALQAIPVGETRSYGDIADAIGQPTASRAVANACARNPVALVIPCHRIIRRDGSLGGYRWGIDRKRALLEREQAYKKPGAG